MDSIVGYPRYENLLHRIQSNVTVTDSGCWEWNLGRDKDGYAKIKFNGQHMRASRVVLQELLGEDVSGKMALHRCDNPPCVNPSHLFTGTASDNMQDMLSKNRQKAKGVKPECPKGHAYTPENSIWKRPGKPDTYRICRKCYNANERRRKNKKTLAA